MGKKTGGDHAFLRQQLHGTTSEATYAGALSFMRRKYTRELAGADLVVSGVPLDTATTNRPGARFGPRAIRAASSIMAWEKPYGMPWDPILRSLAGINLVGMDVVEVAPVYDVGEITALAAATIAMETICLYAARP